MRRYSDAYLLIALAVLFPSLLAAPLSKVDQMRYLQQQEQIIQFNVTGYNYFIMTLPRPYDVVMLYTVTSEKQSCEICMTLQSELELASFSYTHAGANVGTNTSRPVFFGMLEFTKETSNHFRRHDLNTVPFLAMSMPYIAGFPKGQKARHSAEDLWQVRMDETVDASRILEYVNKRTNRNVEVKLPLSTVVMRNLVGATVLIGALMLIMQIHKLLLNTKVWLLIAYTGFVMCVGGTVYNTLNGIPWFKLERDEYGGVRVAEYFQRNQRGQWGGEGYIAAIVMLLTGGSIILLFHADHFATSRVRGILVTWALIALVFFLQYLVQTFYMLKAPWYGPTFYPPDHYIRGPLMNDQGNSL